MLVSSADFFGTTAIKTEIAIETQILADADAVPKEAAKVITATARATVAALGRFVIAVSGGHTPWQMLRLLANEAVPWKSVHVVQVDEKIAPAGDPDRNLTHLRESLLERAPLARGADLRKCRSKKLTSKAQPATTLTPCNRLPARHQCSTSPILDSGRTATGIARLQ